VDRYEWNRRYAAAPRLWEVDPGPFLGAEVGAMAPGRALDLGAGEGRTTLWLAERGWQVTAVDFSDVALDRGREWADAAGIAAAVEWVLSDLVDYVPAPGAFDLVLLLFVHLAPHERRRLLRLAAQALAPGGSLLVVGYDTTHPADGEGGPRDPSIRFSPDDIVAELDGLTVERAERLQVGTAVDAIVRAVR
jgi:SAM-dependent methyltransferase